MTISRRERIISSALWAAYGDALGFMTELADEKRVAHRTGYSEVRETAPWRRKLGSKIGVFVDFPAGTYSDDTQLRLATSRAIRADGSFDVTAFSKVELPAWANYALGAGLSSREAASNLSRSSAMWYSNFYETKRANYVKAGGNGGAMRIQPHVWASKNVTDFRRIFLDVVKNTICTHGHPRAIVGACFHALTLGLAIEAGRPLSVRELLAQTDQLRELSNLIDSDQDLRLFWLGPWLEKIEDSLDQVIEITVDELISDLNLLQAIRISDPETAYAEAINVLGGKDAESRGSATKTALLAAFLAELYSEFDPNRAMLVAANTLGSDTDSIATMAGAILGACLGGRPTAALQDLAYITEEATRLSLVSEGQGQRNFGYPDLRKWKPQRTAVDIIAQTDEGLIVDGISRAELMGTKVVRESQDILLVWLKLSFGQTILARMRVSPSHVSNIRDRVVTDRIRPQEKVKEQISRSNYDLFSSSKSSDDEKREKHPQETKSKLKTLNEALNEIINSNFDEALIGRYILMQCDGNDPLFVEKSIALTANIITAYKARLRN